jgi:uncharacterized membrane protein required for colicin V production
VQVGAVAAVVFATLLCRLGGGFLAGVIAGAEEPSVFDIVVAKAILFVVGYLAVRLVALLFKKVTHALSLGVLDRIGGVLFCLFQWMLVLSLLINFWLVIRPDSSLAEMSTLANGHAAPAIARLAPAVLGWAFS